jgi:hypothetical protein
MTTSLLSSSLCINSNVGKLYQCSLFCALDLSFSPFASVRLK